MRREEWIVYSRLRGAPLVCPRCGSTEFVVVTPVVEDIEFFDDGTADLQVSDLLVHGRGIDDMEEMRCAKCGAEVPEEVFRPVLRALDDEEKLRWV